MKAWSYSLEFSGPMSVFSGHAVAGLLDRKVARNRDGLPYIPGSSIKGRWRHTAARLLAAAPAGSKLTLHDGEFCKERESACTLCRLFGSPAVAGAVWFGQAELTGPLRDAFAALLHEQPSPVFSPGAEIRPGIAVSRVLRSVQPSHLFFDEALPDGISFSGRLLLRQSLRPEEEGFLISSARCIDRIGGGKARGRGNLTQGLVLHVGGELQ